MNKRSSAAHRLLAAIVAGWIFAGLDGGAQEPIENRLAADAAEHESAIAVVAALHRALVAAAALPQVEQRVAALRGEIVASHDLEFIGQLTIRRQWRDLTGQQHSDFLERFEALSVMTYASRFVDVSPESFSMLGSESIGDGRIQVKTSIARAHADAVPIDYVLQEGDSGWRIVNIVADGVSDLALKRAEYTALLRDDGFAALIEELEKQTEDLAL